MSNQNQAPVFKTGYKQDPVSTMNQIGREAALLYKGPRWSPDSENVDARGSESNIEDTNTGGSFETCQRSLEAGSRT